MADGTFDNLTVNSVLTVNGTGAHKILGTLQAKLKTVQRGANYTLQSQESRSHNINNIAAPVNVTHNLPAGELGADYTFIHAGGSTKTTTVKAGANDRIDIGGVAETAVGGSVQTSDSCMPLLRLKFVGWDVNGFGHWVAAEKVGSWTL